MRITSFADASKDLDALVAQVVADADAVIVTGGKGPDVVVMTLADYRGLLETMNLMSSPANAVHLAQSIAQYRAGEVYEHTLIEVADAELDADAQPKIFK